MKWYVEYITPDSANVLIDDGPLATEHTCVGIAFPVALAERIVTLHNKEVPDDV